MQHGVQAASDSPDAYRVQDPIEDKLEVPFTLSGKTGKLVIEATAETKEKKSKVYTYTLFYGSDERRADFLTDGTDDEYPDLAVRAVLFVGVFVACFIVSTRRASWLAHWRCNMFAPTHRLTRCRG